MILRDLTKVYISEYEEIEDHGEKFKEWKYKEIAYLNLQQDINQLDRKPSRTDREYDMHKGNGISLNDISNLKSFKPEYKVTDNHKIGNTTLYKLEKYNGN